MSTASGVKSHPALIQAQNKANYYVGQLDKEVRGELVVENVGLTRLLPFSSPSSLP